MGCCGQSRAEYAVPVEAIHAPPPPARAPEPPASTAAQPASAVRLRFTGQSRVRVRGPATGADYVFSGNDPVAAVHARDVEGLLRTGYFNRAY